MVRRPASPHEPTAQLLLWPGRGLYLGPLLPNDLHAHHAVQITVALDGRLRAQQGTCLRDRAVVITPAGTAHRIATAGTTAQIYLDPEDALARALTASADGEAPHGHVAARRPLCQAWRDDATPEQWREATERFCAALVGQPLTAPRRDERIDAVLALARTTPTRDLRIADAAAAVGLSPSRLAHLFIADTGLPLRRYLLWLRLLDAIAVLPACGSLTDAAHTAGFADSAHLSRTFRQMFGMAPSALLERHLAIHVHHGAA